MFKKYRTLVLVVIGGIAIVLVWFGEYQVLGLITTRPLYEPDDGLAYFGFTFRNWSATDPAYGDTRTFTDRFQDSITYELGGKQVSLFTVPTTWQNAGGSMVNFNDVTNQISLYDGFNNGNSVPVISWSAQTGWGVTNENYIGITTQTINSGSLDDYIHQYAQSIKAYNKPVFIKPICLEVNGSWNHNCSPNANPSLTKTDYINAWHRVVDIFRQENVTNVSWVWNINTFPMPPANWGTDTDFASYYPGDDYVDWVGIDHYDYGSTSTAYTNPMNVAQYLDPGYNFAVQHAKPVMIPEFGIRHPGNVLTADQQQTWLGLMFDYFESHPKIKAVVYFNYNMNGPSTEDATHMASHIWLYNNQVNYHPDSNNSDHRLIAENGANFRSTFSNRISNSRYVSQLQFNTTPLPDSVAPDIMITSPVNNATVSGSVNIATSGYDAYGIARVEFYVDNTLLSTATASPYLASWDTTGYANNTMHNIYAKAYDVANNVNTSPQVTVNVSDITSPTVSISSPTNNSQVLKNKTKIITALASDASEIAKVEFYVNSTLKCTDTTAPYSCNWLVPAPKGVVYALTAKAYDVANNTKISTIVNVTSK